MNFTPTHIELDQADQWFLPDMGSHNGYDKMTEMYWGLEKHFREAIEVEFAALETAWQPDVSFYEATRAIRHKSIEST